MQHYFVKPIKSAYVTAKRKITVILKNAKVKIVHPKHRILVHPKHRIFANSSNIARVWFAFRYHFLILLYKSLLLRFIRNINLSRIT